MIQTTDTDGAGEPGDSAGEIITPETTAPDSVARRALVTVGVVAAVIILLLFFWHARHVVLLVFAGILVGVFLRRLATLVSDHTPLPPTAGLALVVLGLTGALVGAFWLQGDTIAEESARLREELPRAVENLRARIASHELGQRIVEEMPDPEALLPDDQTAITQVTGVVSSTFGALARGVIILFLGVVFAATPGVYVRGVIALVPLRKVPRAQAVLDRLSETLWWWLIGRLIAMAFIGVATGIGLALLGVPLAFILALLAALLSFIPNLGPLLSAFPAILLGLVQGPKTALWVVLLYSGVQMVESYVLDPIIDRKTIYLPPAVTVTAQLVMALFAGLLGLTLATPLAAAAVVLVTMLYVQDVLGRRDVQVGSH
jgi:predicted PurR-regulated permease PerM